VCNALTLVVVVAGLVAFVGGCSSSSDCSGGCEEGVPATYQLACTPNDLTSVAVSGPCSASTLTWAHQFGSVELYSTSPATCSVVLTFATGFTYSTNVTFAWSGAQSCGCPPYIAANGMTMVNNPSDTCHALPDAGGDE
jgi:hypothetical protein